MPRIRLVRVKAHQPDISTIAMAIVQKDADTLGTAVDAAFEFTGPVGNIIEAIDGEAAEAIAEFLIENIDDISAKIAEIRAKRREES